MKLFGYDIDTHAVTRGALVAITIAIPMAFVAGRIIDEGSSWQVPLTFAIFAAFVTGGAVSGRLAPRTPAVHGALSSIPCLIIVTLVAVLSRIFGSGGTTVALIASQIVIATSLGMLGGAATARFGDRTRSLT